MADVANTDQITSDQPLLMIGPPGSKNPGRVVEIAPELIPDALAAGYVKAPTAADKLNVEPLKQELGGVKQPIVTPSQELGVQGATPPATPEVASTEIQQPAPLAPASAADQDIVPNTNGKYIRMIPADGGPNDVKEVNVSLLNDAKKKGYQTVSEYEGKLNELRKQDIAATGQSTVAEKYEEQFKGKYGGAGSTFWTNLNSAAEPFLSSNPKEQKQIEDFKAAGVPEQYRQILRDNNVPEHDWKAATEALDNLQGQHPVAQIAGSLAHPENLALLAVAPEVEAAAIGAVGLEGATGALPSIGRQLVRGAVDTGLFSGPRELEKVIIDKQGAAQTAENLLIDSIANVGLHTVGAGLGKGFEYFKGLKGGGIEDVLAKAAKNIPGVGEASKADAAIAKEIGMSEATIRDYAAGKGSDYGDWDMEKLLTKTDEYIPDAKDLNSTEVGKKVAALGPEAKKETTAVLKDLDEASKPGSKVEIPDAHKIGLPESTAQKDFVNQYLEDRYNELLASKKVALPFEDWKSTSAASEGKLVNDVDKFTLDAEKQFKDIQSGKLKENDFINSKLETNFNREFHPDYTAKTHPEEFLNWSKNEADGKLTAALAKEQFDAVNRFSSEKIGLKQGLGTPSENYAGRASGTSIQEKFDKLAGSAQGTLHEKIITDADKAVRKLTDSSGKISPSDMQELSTHFSDLVKEGGAESNVQNELRRTIAKIVNEEKTVAEAKIAGGSGQQDLLARLEKARDKNVLFKDLGEGKALISKPRVPLGPQVAKGGLARIGVHGGVSAVGASVGYVLGNTPQEKRRYATIGGAAGLLSSLGTFVLAKPMMGYWSELGSKRLNYALRRQLSKTDVVSHLVIDGAKRQQSFLSKIPTILADVASKRVDVAAIKKEKDSFDGFKVLLGDEANGLSKQQQYQRIFDRLNDPNVSTKQVQIGADSNNSNLASAITQQIANMHTVLKANLPPIKSNVPFSENKPQTLVEKQIKDFSDVVRLVNNPEELFKDYQDKSITPQKVNIVKTVFPGQYANMMQRADLESHNIHFDLQERLYYSILHGNTPIDPSQNLLGQLQAVSAIPTTAPAPSGKQPRAHKGSKEGSASYATSAQKGNYK